MGNLSQLSYSMSTDSNVGSMYEITTARGRIKLQLAVAWLQVPNIVYLRAGGIRLTLAIIFVQNNCSIQNCRVHDNRFSGSSATNTCPNATKTTHATWKGCSQSSEL